MNQERWISEMSNIGWMVEVVWYQIGVEIFMSPCQTVSGTYQSPIQQAQGMEMKWHVHEDKQYLLFNAKV
jgi:hypothetical protein